jgi:hypothetical protein
VDLAIPLIEYIALGVLVFNLATRSLPEEERHYMLRLMAVAYTARLALACSFYIFPQLRIFHEDSDGLERIAVHIATYWRGEGPPWITRGVNAGYLYFMGAQCLIFGRFKVIPSFTHALLGTLLCLLVYKLATRFFHPIVGRRAAWLVCLMPSMILWSALAVKDVTVTFLIVLALSSCVALKERVTPASVLGTVVPLVLIQPVRFYIMYFVGFAIIVSLILDRGMNLLTGIYKQIFLAMFIVGLFVLLGMSGRVQSDADLYFDLEFASSYRHGMAVGAQSGFDHDVDVSTPSKALAYLPIGVAHLLFAPFPWQLTSLRPLMAAPETFFWWFLVPATLRGIFFGFRHRFAGTSPLMIFAITLTCGYSLIHGNVGSGFRQRAQIFVFFFIFSALGIYLKRCKKAGIDTRHLLQPAPGDTLPAASAPQPAPARPPGLSPRPG